VARCAGECEGGHATPLAPQGISALLALEVPANGKTSLARRPSGSDPENGRRKPHLGRGTHCQRTEDETRDPGLAPHRRKIPEQRRSSARARSETALADVRSQPRQSDRGMRLLRGRHGQLPHPLCICDHGIGHPANPSSQRHRPPDGGVDLAAVSGGAARRSSLSIPDPRSGHHLLQGSGQASGRDGCARVANPGPGAPSELCMRALRRDPTPRVPGLSDPDQRTPSQDCYQGVGNPLQSRQASLLTWPWIPGTRPGQRSGQRPQTQIARRVPYGEEFRARRVTS